MLRIPAPGYLLWVALLFVHFNAEAQRKKNTFFFGGGYSLPIGKFASKALDDPKAGMAGSGVFGQVYYERALLPGLGFRFTASHNVNKTNPEQLIFQANYLAETWAPFIGETGVYSWTSDPGDWKQTSLMVGPTLSFPVGPIRIEVHAQAGRLFITSPHVIINGTSTSGNNPILAVMNPIKSECWGFSGGLSLAIPLGKVVQFNLFADAIGAEATFKDIALRGTVGALEATHTISETRPVGIVNTGAGFAIRF